MKLEIIKPPLGATHKEKRVGRGDSSGHGGTSTRGHKGHKARKGFSLSYNFEGGQMPLVRRLPKRGFTHLKKVYPEIINIEEIDKVFDENTVITPALLKEKGIIKKGVIVKILGRGEIKKKIEIHAHMFSDNAKNKIEKAGGKTVIIKKQEHN
ncbi:MAG: 50S ribosomal protein L15 [Candidatus Ratteibacteria bacterium]|nr:50S ribosomal protein L15 [Candidatus Ratteibacteria bacterium]